METSLAPVGFLALLGLGLLFGFKHATEVDHVVAVSTIVSEQRDLWRSALVGGLWGAGHTAALMIAGVGVLVFRIAIPPSVARWLEFGVALMIIGLGLVALGRVLRRRADLHLHRHSHDGESHVHIHFHERGTEHVAEPGREPEGEREVEPCVEHSTQPAGLAPSLSRVASEGSKGSHSHTISHLGFKPVLIGAMHGLAGSAALTLLVLTQIQSVSLGLLYLGVFGAGSTLGMLLMSGLIGLPFVFSGRRLTTVNYGLQTIAGTLSILFGLWYAYRVGIN